MNAIGRNHQKIVSINESGACGVCESRNENFHADCHVARKMTFNEGIANETYLEQL